MPTPNGSVHGFIHWHLGFNGVQEADELLMPVTLHVAPNDGAIEHVQGGKQRGGAMALVVVRHGPEAALLRCAVARLKLLLWRLLATRAACRVIRRAVDWLAPAG